MLSPCLAMLSLFRSGSPEAVFTTGVLTTLLGAACLAFLLRHQSAGDQALRNQLELIRMHRLVDRLRLELREARSQGEPSDHLLAALRQVRLQLPPGDLRR